MVKDDEEERFFVHVHMGTTVAELERTWWLTPVNDKGKYIVSDKAIEADAIPSSKMKFRLDECAKSYGHNGIVGACTLRCDSGTLLTYKMRKVLNLT